MVDSDILLLDISNNDEYTWTTIFEPSVQTKSSTPSTTTIISVSSSQQSNTSSNNVPIVIGITIGTFISISLVFGGVFLYRRNKNKQRHRKSLIPIN